MCVETVCTIGWREKSMMAAARSLVLLAALQSRKHVSNQFRVIQYLPQEVSQVKGLSTKVSALMSYLFRSSKVSPAAGAGFSESLSLEERGDSEVGFGSSTCLLLSSFTAPGTVTGGMNTRRSSMVTNLNTEISRARKC